MAGSLSADDKLLGEKMHYYCSSSEDEYQSCEEGSGDEIEGIAPTHPTASSQDYSGGSKNTGPKGVIRDWQKFKQLESEKREEKQLELINLQKKLSLTCRSHLDDDKEKTEDEKLFEELEDLEDEFMMEYRKKRVEEMRSLFRNMPEFGTVFEITRPEELLDHTENQHPLTTVIIHLYEKNMTACETMNRCMDELACQFSIVKFCKVQAHLVQLSSKFSEEGVPALLVYKEGDLIGNLVSLRDLLGDDFCAADIERLLNAHSLLPQRTVVSEIAANI